MHSQYGFKEEEDKIVCVFKDPRPAPSYFSEKGGV